MLPTPGNVQNITPYHWDGNHWICAPLGHSRRSRAPLSLATLNTLHDSSPWFVRAALGSEIWYTTLLEHLESLNADVLGLNEVAPRTLQLLLSCPFIRESYYVSESLSTVYMAPCRSPSAKLASCCLYTSAVGLRSWVSGTRRHTAPGCMLRAYSGIPNSERSRTPAEPDADCGCCCPQCMLVRAIIIL